ncbi:putative membrane protein [Bacteroides fragilis str. 1007-1-F |nr:putative membrane protein [Bacteroides fragilis str. 1007-1-F \
MGIGGTIDYIRQNETAKQLPDKCIKALDLFMDKVIEDGNDNKTLE